jgi:hypothetical protein
MVFADTHRHLRERWMLPAATARRARGSAIKVTAAERGAIRLGAVLVAACP